MDYAEARAAFFQPRTGTVAEPDPASPARSLRDAIEPLAMVCYWSRPAYDALEAHGLDFLTGYAWGRASAMGDVAGPVAAAAFGVFEPGLVAGLVDAGRAAATRDEITAARETGSAAALEAALGGTPDGVGDAVATLRRGLEVADLTGRALFAGLTSLPWPEHPLGQLWHATTMLRELRGDGHLAALVAVGVSGCEANLLTEMRLGWEPYAYAGTRGWAPEVMQAATTALALRGLVADGALTKEGAALRDGVEDATDRIMQPVVDAIGPDLGPLVTQLDAWSSKVVEAGWFPPDPLKRAAG